jgi:hypothetical protein
MIDPSTGTLSLQGYAEGIEDNIIINYKDAKPLSSAHPDLNRLRFRHWNYHLLYTDKHIIQFNFVDALSFGKRGVCPSNIVIFERSNPAGTMKKIEEKTFHCPEFNREVIFDFEQPSY